MGMSSPTLPEPGCPQRELLVSKGWLQAVALVVLFGFFVLGLLAYRTATSRRSRSVVDPAGETIYTRDDVMAGQKVFLRNGLMEHGLSGHGAYLGPDYTASTCTTLPSGCSTATAGPGRTACARARSRTSRRTATTRTATRLEYTEAQADAFGELRDGYLEFFSNPTTEFGLRPRAIDDEDEIHELTAYFSWSAWTAAAAGLGHNYSYTNSWPPEAARRQRRART